MPKFITFLLFLMVLCSNPIDSQDLSADNNKMMWWREARFGMFIHYGLYSQCEGYWKGEPVDGIGEWIFHHAEIPVEEYKALATTFTAKKLDVEYWVKLAKQAGMKYIVITTKHHDGFALFKSKVNEFNIVDATPYGKDLIKDFVEACRKHDMKIGFYYSQFQDWSYPGAGGNDWDPGFEWSRQGFKLYMKNKALPQVKELLSNYGKIDMIWFDTPGKMTKDESEKFLNLAKELQPEIIVSGRVGNEVGDYIQMEDNALPKSRPDFDWEVPVTMNHTWAYKRDDNHWKSTDYMLWQLTYSASMGGNYLLNIGPKGDGSIPQVSIERLNEIGNWMKVNSEAVYGSQSSPFKNAFEWGGITHKENKLYLNIAKWPDKELSVNGLKNSIKKACLLHSQKDVEFYRKGEYLVLDLSRHKPEKHINVIVLEFEGEPDVAQDLVQNLDGSVILEAELAKNETAYKTHFGSMLKWFKPGGKLSWEFKITQPGTYKIEVITTGFKRMAWPERPALWDGGHNVLITCNNNEISGIIDNDYEEQPPYDLYNTFKVAELGEINLPEQGNFTLELIPKTIETKNKAGLAIRMVRLIPVKQGLKVNR